MDADNYFKVFKAWGLLLILCLLKFSNFFISVDSQYAFVINSVISGEYLPMGAATNSIDILFTLKNGCKDNGFGISLCKLPDSDLTICQTTIRALPHFLLFCDAF